MPKSTSQPINLIRTKQRMSKLCLRYFSRCFSWLKPKKIQTDFSASISNYIKTMHENSENNQVLMNRGQRNGSFVFGHQWWITVAKWPEMINYFISIILYLSWLLEKLSISTCIIVIPPTAMTRIFLGSECSPSPPAVTLNTE